MNVNSMEVFFDGVRISALFPDANTAVVVVLVPLVRTESPLYGSTLRLVPEDGTPEAEPRTESKRRA